VSIPGIYGWQALPRLELFLVDLSAGHGVVRVDWLGYCRVIWVDWLAYCRVIWVDRLTLPVLELLLVDLSAGHGVVRHDQRRAAGPGAAQCLGFRV
jgi:hypothetical protein